MQSLAGLVVLPARQARVASFGVPQPRCRTGRTRHQARAMPFTLPVSAMMCVLVTIIM
ncbi:MAG: hypothetical protein ACUVSL_01755 [Chloroflexus sp.]|uniref:hypothetical protein n=1 Tax=Chloroflexus sp. TaxID=1904827 RepID=UPI00404ACDDE